jgi:hypothetical protein
MLDLRNNTASRMGEVQHWERTSSTWQSSPGGRYGVMQPTTSTGSSFVLCDLAKGEFTEIREPGGPCGWWTDHEILMKDASMNQFDLYDVGTRRRRPLFSPADVQAVLVKEGLAGSITNLYAFPNWNGQSYDFYFYPPESWGGLRNPDTSLFKADQADPALKLLYRSFRVRWGAHLDATGAHYLYPGESGKPGSSPDGAVYLENLTDGTTVTVVSPDNKGGYSSPAFYGGEVVYFRNRLLRRVQINGSNDTPLLPINVK